LNRVSAHLPPYVEIIAHRGASYSAPENTLAAVELAWQQGCTAVEVDVHVSQDGRIMAIHDDSTGRTAWQDLVISECASTRLRQLDVGRFHGEAFAGQRIPYLEEVLETVPTYGILFLDVKCDARCLPILERLLAGRQHQGQVKLIAFCLHTMTAAKRQIPGLSVLWLRRNICGMPYARRLIAQAQAAGLDGLDLQWSGVTAEFVRAAHSAGLQIVVWTVDRPQIAQRLVSWGVQGITTNRPELLRLSNARPLLVADHSRALATDLGGG
jgi:glycerophosphoryl diester phosphodiesterase